MVKNRIEKMHEYMKNHDGSPLMCETEIDGKEVVLSADEIIKRDLPFGSVRSGNNIRDLKKLIAHRRDRLDRGLDVYDPIQPEESNGN